MGKNKDAAIGFGVIAVIITIIVGVVVAILPESETTQSEVEKNEPIRIQDEAVNEPTSNVEFDPIVVNQAKESIPEFQNLFKMILNECNAVNSNSDYIIFGIALTIIQEEFTRTLNEMDMALTILELSGYDEHATVGPLIKETRQLAGEAGVCIIDLQNKYGN